MKHTKKLFALALTLIMALSLTVPALAANSSTTDAGKIIIENPVADENYDLYRIFNLESFNNDNNVNAYSYKVRPADAAASDTDKAWNAFAYSAEIKDVYIKIDSQGYVTWNGTASAVEFAAKALAFAENTTDSYTVTKETASYTVVNGNYEYEDLPLGYYLIDSSLGSLCALSTADDTVTMYEKNAAPSLDKNVKEDDAETGKEWGKENDADIFQTIEFMTTVTIPNGGVNENGVEISTPGAQNYVIHDKMDSHLVLDNASIEVKLNDTELTSGYSIKINNTADDTADEACTFEIAFDEDTCKALVKGDKITVTYMAKFAADVAANTEYTNTAYLTYGDPIEANKTPEVTTKSQTHKFSVIKYTDDNVTDPNGEDGNKDFAGYDAEDTRLGGAKFTLSKNQDGRSPMYFVKSVAQDGKVTYTYAKDGTVSDATTELMTEISAKGEFTIFGLDSATYWLTETAAPEGYNVLAGNIKVKIEADGKVYFNDAEENDDGLTIEVENNTGTELPSTGGMGTTIFYIVGSVLMVGAAVLLVTKKKMSNEQ